MSKKTTLNDFYEPILLIGFLLFGLAALSGQTVTLDIAPYQCIGNVNTRVLTSSLPQGDQIITFFQEDQEWNDLNTLPRGEYWINVRVDVAGQSFFSTEKVGLFLSECSSPLDVCESIQLENESIKREVSRVNDLLSECQLNGTNTDALNQCNANLALSNQLYNDCLSNNYDSLLTVYYTVRKGLDNYIVMVQEGQNKNNTLQTTNDSLLLVLSEKDNLISSNDQAYKDLQGVLEQTNKQLADCQTEKDSIQEQSDKYLADLIQTNEELVECTFQEPTLRDTCLSFYAYLNGCACTMEITPNPNSGELTVNVAYDVGTDVRSVTIQIIELSGKVVKSYDTNNAQVIGLERGEYKAVATVQCDNKRNTITKTILVQ